MSVSWEAFKAQLGFWQNASVVYVDDEGSEIPIDSDLEFQEALRLAKVNKKRLNLIIYDDNMPKMQKMFETPMKCRGRMCEPPHVVIEPSHVPHLHEKLPPPLMLDPNLQDMWHCRANVPPPWFTHYMKKFKKDLIHELKASITNVVENAIAKNNESPNSKSDTSDGLVFFDKIETQFSPVACQPSYSTAVQNKKKRKVSEKDLMDLTKQREIKVPKRLEKLREKSERLEKLRDKTRVFLEEKKRLLEKILYFKMKLDKMGVVVSDKRTARKSASFREHEVFLCLTPKGEFTLNVNIINDGKIAWSAPRLECHEFSGLQIEEPTISLPKLLPMESCVATLRGKADKTDGLLHFKCRLIDGVEKIGSEFTCWAKVDFEAYEKYCKVLVNSSKSDDISRSEESVDALIDFEKDLIASSEKKIEENIIEIEKKLQDLDLLQTLPAEEAILKSDAEKSEETSNSDKPEDDESVDCDLLQISEEKEKNRKEKLEEEEVLFGVDCLGLAPESNDACIAKMVEINDENEKIKKDRESESSCNSELSVICMSEEDENFFVVPLPSKTPSPAQSVHEDEKSLSEDSVDKPDVIRINERLVKANADTTNDFCSNQFSPARMRRSSLGEISESKPKKMKSESTEYRFTTANLTQPTFTPIPEGFIEARPSKFTFTGEKKERCHSEGIFDKSKHSKFTFSKEKEEAIKNRNVPKTDALGRVIYAVNANGYCQPVGDVFENGEYRRNHSGERCRNSSAENCRNSSAEHCGNHNGENCRNHGGEHYRTFISEHCRNHKGHLCIRQQKNPNRCEKRCDRFNEIPGVITLPHAFRNGASNVASFAFNTAKSVINNLHSAFVTEGKAELGKPAFEDKRRVFAEAMFKLSEMGFSDVQLNQKLLVIHNNDLMKVIEELVRIKENSPNQSQ